MKIPNLAIAAALLLAGSPSLRADQNLLVNPDFDTGLSGWQVVTPPSSSATWDGTRDADGSPASGAGQGVFHDDKSASRIPLFTQCVPVTIGKTYRLAGNILLFPDNTTLGDAYLGVQFFPSTDCSGQPPASPFQHTPAVFSNGWIRSAANFLSDGRSAAITTYIGEALPGTFTADFDDLDFEEAACTADAHTLCLHGGRFAVSATFDAGHGQAGAATVAPITDDAGYLWFFNPSNVEVVAKLIDACSFVRGFWFFAAGLTDVQVTITVTDEQTGAQNTYKNPARTPFAPIQDTSAFYCG